MPIFDDLDLGRSTENEGPSSGQEGGSVVVSGGRTISWGRAGKAQARSQIVNVRAPFAVGGAAADSKAAVTFNVQQLIELANNTNRQPVYIQWDSGDGIVTPNPWDGYYRLDDVHALDWGWPRHVPCQVTATLVALGAPNRISMAYAGESVVTDYSGLGQKLIALPVGATGIENNPAAGGAFARVGADGPFSCALVPVANPSPFTPSAVISDFTKGGVKIFDTVIAGGNPVPAAFFDDGAETPSSISRTLFRSIGNDATGTLNAWTTMGGAPTIAANLVTMPNGARLRGGHTDWQDLVFRARFRFNTNALPFVQVHANGASDFNDVQVLFDGVNMALQKHVAGVFTGTVGSQAAALVNGTFYWVEVTAVGTSYSAAVFNDAAGAIGAQIGAGITGVISDAALQTGMVALGCGGTAGCAFGGAFNNVCIVNVLCPLGWTIFSGSGEPAYAWSSAKAYSGTKSLSIRNNHSGDNGNWLNLTADVTGVSYTVAGQVQVVGGSGGNTALVQFLGPTPASDGAWHQAGGAYVPAADHNAYFSASGVQTAYFDAYTMAVGTLAAGPAVNPNWVEIRDTEHDFTGDCVLTNGLVMLVFRLGLSIADVYFWNEAAWRLWANINYADTAISTGTLRAIVLQKISLEECALEVTTGSVLGRLANVTFRLKRGHHLAFVALRPLTESAVGQSYSLFLNILAGASAPKLLYSSGKPSDVSLAEASPSVPADYGYGAVLIETAGSLSVSQPVIGGFLYQNKPGAEQPKNNGNAVVGLGDTIALPISAERQYGLFVARYPYAAYLAAEAETGTLGAGWTSQAGAGGNSNALEAKCASGTTVGNVVNGANSCLFGTAWSPPAGTYDVWVRLKVTSAAGAVAEMQIGLRNTVTGAFVAGSSTTLRANQAAVGYTWVRVATGLVLPAANTIHFAAVPAATLGTDWFIDEAMLAVLTLSSDHRGPQELWQQFLPDLSVVQVQG